VSQPVRILRLAAGGDGVGKLADGRAVFVPRTAPGDLVTVRGLRPSRRFARATLGRLLEPGPDRVTPRCPHYTDDECGGCQLQHLSYPAQLAARRGFAGDALRRLARLEVTDPEIEPAERQYGYRTKLTLAAAGPRRIGLHPYGRPRRIFDLACCHIAAPPLMELWARLRELRSLLPAGLERLVLRMDRRGGRHAVARVRGTEVWTRAAELARELERAGAPATLWWEPEGGVARVLAAPTGGAESRPGEAGGAGPGGAPHVGVFEQVHPAMAERARAYALERAGPVAGRRVWDLYAGIGETTARLAAAGAVVESVELDRRAVAFASATGPPAERHAGPAEELVDRLGPPDLVVTNPPRTGMDARVTAAIAERRPEKVIYLSCDPATLARDIVRLGTGFRLAAARCFDLFPQTAHVETVAVLERV